MPDESPERIPRELHEAFWAAVGAFHDWGRGQPEPKVSYNQNPVPISFVCDLVMIFKTPMPHNLWRLLGAVGGSDALLKDHTYASGARCLAQLIREKEEFGRP
jgi:hypothetical protein